MKSKIIALCALFTLSELNAYAEDVYLVANPETQISSTDVKDIFSGEKQFFGSQKIVPVDNGTLQADFLAKVFKIPLDRYNALWTKKSFRYGINPPAVKVNDADVIAFVKSTPGAVGYVSKPSPAVKIIEKY